MTLVKTLGRVVISLTLCAGLAARAEEGPETLTLAQAVDELDAKNLTLAQARARAQEARGLVRQALAQLLPTVGAGASYTRNNEDATIALNTVLDSIEAGISRLTPVPVTLDRTGVPRDAIIQPLEAWSASGAVRVPLFAANGYADVLAAQGAARAQERSVEAAKLTLRGALEQAGTWAQAAEDIALASERALAIAEAHEQSAGRAVQAGTAAPLTHLQAKTEVVRRQSEVVRTRAEKERAWLALGVLLGRATPVRVTMPADAAPPADLALDAQLARALAERPELKVQEAMIDAARWQVSSAWWRLAPTLSASFSGVYSNIAFVTGLNYGWKATVDLSWTLYDGGFRYGKRQQAEAQVSMARAAHEALSLEVQQQVRDARRDVEVARQRLTLAARQKGLAEEAAGTARRSFEAGLASSLDVLDANDKLYLAEVGEADARARLGMASVSLERATASFR